MPRTAVVKGPIRENVADAKGLFLEIPSGTHPWFHDLERQSALRDLAQLARNDPYVGRLHRLLEDAHERIAESTAEIDRLSDEVEEVKNELEGVKEDAKNASAECDHLDKRVEELQDVEPLATAFAELASSGFQVKDADLSPSQRVVVQDALDLLRG